MVFNKKTWVIFYLGFLVLILCLILEYNKNISHNLKSVFLDVGQGDATLIITPSKQKILIDGGPENNLGKKINSYFSFFDKTIDLVILTHPDSDHLIGLLSVLENYQVKEIILPPINKDNALFIHFLQTAQTKKIPLVFANSETDFKIDHNLFLDFLYPLRFSSNSEINQKDNTSLIFKVIYGKNVFLFSGDASQSIEKTSLLSPQNFSAKLYQVGHHGSKTSSSDSFLQAISPQIAVISAGRENPFGHPHPEIIQKLKKQEIKIYNTQIDRNIILISDGSGNFQKN